MKTSKHTLIRPGIPNGFLLKLELYCLTREDARTIMGNDDVPYFQLLQSFSYQSEILGGVIVVPSNPKPFITDLGTIPRLVWSWLSPDDYDISYPSVIHDYLYKMKGDLRTQVGLKHEKINRKTADDVLKEAMASVGASGFRQFVVYQAVRNFGPRW
jgi:hypothetical protein